MYAIDLKHIYKSYGSRKIFDDFNLIVKEGEMISVYGESGSGKTTLLNMIGLIEPVEKGVYRLFGNKNIRPNSRKVQKIMREDINYLFQNYALVDNLIVMDNLTMALEYTTMNKQEKKACIKKALADVGLANYERMKIPALSGAEQQKVAVARAIIKPCKVILADEPTGALDGENRDEIFRLLHKLNKSGKTIVIATHDPELADRCDRIISLTPPEQRIV